MPPPRPATRADPERIGAQLRRQLAGFTRTLQAHGFRVGLAETRDALRILTSPMAEGPRSLAAAWRALFCATHSDWNGSTPSSTPSGASAHAGWAGAPAP